MANKNRTSFILPSDRGNSFDDEDFILNYRPKIEFVEPEQINNDPEETLAEPEGETIDSFRDRTQKLINDFRAISVMIDVAQQRVDQRAKDLAITLDPIKDQITIAAMKRCFPDKADPSTITYEDYKACIGKMQANAPGIPAVSAVDVQEASTDPYRTDFGGLKHQRGENRAEISSPANSVTAPDLAAFQSAAVLALFAMMRPLIKLEDSISINKHLATAGHLGGAPDVPVGVV